MRSCDTVAHPRVRAELVIQAVVTAFAEQIEVEVGEFVREEVRVVLDDDVIEREAHAQPVRNHRATLRNAAFEQARLVDALERIELGGRVLPEDLDDLGARLEHAHYAERCSRGLRILVIAQQ